MTQTSSPTFEPPSPGAWELMRVQFARPLSGFLAAVYPPAFMRGYKDVTRHYGALLDHYEIAVLNSLPYYTPRAVAAPKDSKGPPPRFVFAIARRLHPEIRSRVRRAEEVFKGQLWRRDVELWDGEVKPGTLARAKALAAEDVGALSVADLASHLRRAVEFLDFTFYNQYRFMGCTMLPLGDFVAHVTEWTGLSHSEIIEVFSGQTPLSCGAVEEMNALRAAVRADASALALLGSAEPPAQILEALSAFGGAVGPAVRAYLDTVGLRILGSYDVADPNAREHPELVVRILRAAVAESDGDRGAQAGQAAEAAKAVAALRAKVPEQHRALFDELFREATDTYRIRDERNFFGSALALGIARRSLMEVGRRLALEGKVEKAEHIVEATPDEAVELASGKGGGPSAAELARRHAYRSGASLDTAPIRLGLPPSPPPPAEWLPPPAARLLRALISMTALYNGPEEQARADAKIPKDLKKDSATPSQEKAKNVLRGLAGGPGVYEGVARVVTSPAQFPEVRQGEILVARTTSVTFNVVLPLLGAIVTDRGGVLSHAAIVSREYGIPSVVGCAGATAAISTGTRLRVDGGSGEVWILD